MKLNLQLSSFWMLVMIQLALSADTGSFWQVTDVHYDKTYLHPTNPDKICNSQTPDFPTPKGAGIWGDYLCDSPWDLINSSVAAMKELEPKPDFIIWTGDDIAHVSNDELSTEEVIETVKNVTELISSNFPNVTVYPCLGNHDYHPKHLMPPRTNQVYEQVGDLWSRWLPSDAVNSFKKGGFYSTLIKRGLRIISLNTVYYYTNDKLTANISDPAGQFQWLDDVITNASNAGEKVFIIGHVPPGAFERFPKKKWFYPQFNKRYIQLILKHADVIKGQFMAHQHCDSFKVFYDDKGIPRSSLFLCPAVTPWTTTLPGVGGNNPSVRLYKYDRNTATMKDVLQYFTNLTEANIRGSPRWLLEYQATSVFGIPDVTTQSLHQLAKSFEEDSSENFKKYYKFNSVSYDENCDETCKVSQICAITKVDFDKFNDCVSSPSGSSPSSPSGSSPSSPSEASGNPAISQSFVFLLPVAFVLHL